MQEVIREPEASKGYEQYNTSEFRQLCDKLAVQVADTIEGLIANNFEVVAILGIEYSPSCAVVYQYGGPRGTIHQQGVFIEMLKKHLAKKQISIPLIGINKRGVEPVIKKLRELLNPQETFL